ncbi:NUDIX hydrolase [Pseudooceanicola sp. LIPI14-2-Ac024]|uniref:NUDIX hydrolase n=1 Tax=Pseudooceanicola sp. LIPI14-2-Ac024 TaxID=3344875 RepID=UPI0035D0137D
MFHTLWQNYIAPVLRRPARFQVAALCYRQAAGGPEILLITSRETKRWVLPKGWPKSGLEAAGTAIEEAWEEAGVITRSHTPPLVGTYRYDKRLRGGVPVETVVNVYAISVKALHDDYPEKDERDRVWKTASAAAAAVDEPELKDLLLRFPAQLQDGLSG